MTATLSGLKIGIVGLGYVGLPLLCTFAKKYPVIGFDISGKRVSELQSGIDRTGELAESELIDLTELTFSTNVRDLATCNVFIVSVPTPIDSNKNPDLEPLESACESVGSVLQAGDTVIFESTVFPGATEEICIPILEQVSGLKGCNDFMYGYSPERINPGDKTHRLEDIMKVTSGCDEQTADFVDLLYSSIIHAGTFKAASIKTAEAAKVIENTQRDVNIALINELSVLFDRLEIDTADVLEAASTKWNFLQFTPGLVGGHCIGVDPYYLTYKAEQVGHKSDVILAGRRINDSMADFVSSKLMRLLEAKNISVPGCRILVMGLTFKENCPDIRNSQVFRIVRSLENAGAGVDVLDPWVSEEDASGINLIDKPQEGSYHAILVAVNHRQFKQMPYSDIQKLCANPGVVFDLKQVFEQAPVDARL